MTYKLTYEEVQKLYNQLPNNDKTVYRYKPDDEYVFSGEEIAGFDPLESQISGKVVLLLPADCTFNKPPKNTKDGIFVYFDKKNEEWKQTEDRKGKFYYNFEKKSMEEIKTHIDKDNRLVLTEDDKKEIYSGKTVRLVNGKYDFYFTDEQLKSKIISDANMYLSMYDFYFNSDYPTEKFPVRMVEYREYLRGLNSEHNLKDKDVQNLKVMTYEEFVG